MPQVLCARCKRDYRDQYDSCPWCGQRREKPPASRAAVVPDSRPSTPVSAPMAAPQASKPVAAPIIAPQVSLGESLTLGRVLMSVAVIWGLIGLANVVNVFVTGSSAAARSFAFLFGVLFVLFPSLAFFAWGSSRNSRIKSAGPAIRTTAAGVTGPSRASSTGTVDEMPVWQLSWYAMKMPFEKLAIFLQLAIVPLAISIVLGLPAILMGRTSTNTLTHLAQRGIATALIALAIALALKLVIEVPFQVRWLRLVVLGESTPRGRGYFRFDEAEKRYMRYSFLMLGISIPAAVSCVSFMGQPKGSAGAGGAALLFLGLFALTAIVWVRLAFVLPQVASNRFGSLAVSWNQTSGIGWRLFAAIATGTLPLGMASTALLECRTSSNGLLISICALAGGVFFDYTSRAALLAVVAVAYRDWGIRVDQASRETVATVA